jgi:hypothetical protein
LRGNGKIEKCLSYEYQDWRRAGAEVKARGVRGGVAFGRRCRVRDMSGLIAWDSVWESVSEIAVFRPQCLFVAVRSAFFDGLRIKTTKALTSHVGCATIQSGGDFCDCYGTAVWPCW